MERGSLKRHMYAAAAGAAGQLQQAAAAPAAAGQQQRVAATARKDLALWPALGPYRPGDCTLHPPAAGSPPPNPVRAPLPAPLPAGVLGENVKIVREKTKIVVTSEVAMSKRYLKYLTKK